MEGGEMWFIFITGIVIGLLFGWMITSGVGIDISQETGDDICKNLTGNQSAVAKDYWEENSIGPGKLACETPSYDSTQNIIIRQNNDGDN